MDIKEIAKNNSRTKHGKEFCFVKSENKSTEERTLLVVLSTHNQYKKYFLFRSFLENLKFDTLFLTDDNTWYLNDNKGADFIDIISEIINEQGYKKENVVIFGTSMGGYGAAYFAIQLGVHCLLSNPQMNLLVSRDWAWPELKNNLNKVIQNDNDVDLISEYEEHVSNSIFFVIHGHNPIDEVNVNLFLTSLNPNKKIILYSYDADDHGFPFERNVLLIYQCVNLIIQYSKINLIFDETNDLLVSLKGNRDTRRKSNYPHLYEKKLRDRINWATRSILQPGCMYTFKDIGIFKDGKFSGLIYFYDELKNWHLCSPSLNQLKASLYNFDINFNDGYLSNNKKISNDCWARIVDGIEIQFRNSRFELLKASNKLMYLNFDVPSDILKEWNVDPKVKPFTVGIDIDLPIGGSVTISMVYVNLDGKYVEQTKKITKSGFYTIYDYIYNLKFKHNKALSLRIYPCLDKNIKWFKINCACCDFGFIPSC